MAVRTIRVIPTLLGVVAVALLVYAVASLLQRCDGQHWKPGQGRPQSVAPQRTEGLSAGDTAVETAQPHSVSSHNSEDRSEAACHVRRLVDCMGDHLKALKENPNSFYEGSPLWLEYDETAEQLDSLDEAEREVLFGIVCQEKDAELLAELLPHLAKCPDAGLTVMLKELMSRADVSIRRSVATTLARIGSDEALNLLGLLAQTDADEQSAQWAADLLAYNANDSSKSLLLEWLRSSPSSLLRARAARAIASLPAVQMSETVKHQLIQSLATETEESVLEAIAGTLKASLGTLDCRTILQIVFTKNLPDSVVSDLVRACFASAPLQDIVTACNSCESGSARRTLMGLLADAKDPLLLPLLKEAALNRSEDQQTRLNAFRGLSGLLSEEETPFFERWYADEVDSRIRAALLWETASRRKERAFALITREACSNDAVVAEAAVRLLGIYGNSSSKSLLEAIYSDRRPSEVRTAALYSLCELFPDEELRRLANAASDDGDAEVRSAALHSIVFRFGPLAIPQLQSALLRDEGEENAASAAFLLGEIGYYFGSTKAEPLLRQCATTHVSSSVRQACERAVQRATSYRADNIEVLRSLLDPGELERIQR